MLWGLVPMGVGAVLFLLWFGNYTASMYRDLYGSVPTPPQMESEPKPQEASWALQNYGGFLNAFTSCVSSCIPASFYSRSIVLNKEWTARIDKSDG